MSTRLRLLAPVLAAAFAVAACGGSATPTPSPTAAPTASPTAEPTAAPTTAAFCGDAAALRASIAALATVKPLEVGTNGVKAAVTDVAERAQALLLSSKDLIAAPLTNLLASVQALQATLIGLGNQQGLGSALVAVRSAIDNITSAAADVEAALGTTCPAQ